MIIHAQTQTTTDFILTYRDDLDKQRKGKEDTDEKKEKRRAKREKFLNSCVELGLEYEIQDCSVRMHVYSTCFDIL